MLMAARILSARTMNFDGQRSPLRLRNVTTYVLATAGAKIAKKGQTSKRGAGVNARPLFLLSNVDNCYRKWTVLAAREGPTPMLLRDHPLFSYHGMHSWPPVWTWMSGGDNKHPRGEVGILRRVEKSHALPANRCFLFIDYEDSSYIGCLLCSEHGFCKSIVRVRVLEAHVNKSIAQIGGLDISRLL